MGWLDRFRSSGVDSGADDLEENSLGAMKAVCNNNEGNGSTKTKIGFRMPSADLAHEYRTITDLTQLDEITLDNGRFQLIILHLMIQKVLIYHQERRNRYYDF